MIGNDRRTLKGARLLVLLIVAAGSLVGGRAGLSEIWSGSPGGLIAELQAVRTDPDPSSGCFRQAPPPPTTARHASVRRVIDGDTFVTSDGTRVRILGVNAPESADPRRPVEPLGRETATAARRLLDGQSVWIQPGRQPEDRYGRLLAWIWLEDGRFVNAELVRLGYARVHTFPDNPDYAPYLLLCQREAQDAGRGLWER